MKLSFTSLAVAALAAQTVVGDSWFGATRRAAYNKWHETELERWLSDNNVPYPTPADRKDLEDLVKSNWENNVVKPYNSWDVNQLTNYFNSKGYQIKKGTEKNKDSLVSQIQAYWTQTESQASEAYSNVQGWIFDSWTESQLKSFLDYHGIPNPSPRTRDSLLHTARSNYQTIANKAGETAAYPGDWLYQAWSESDLKSWLDQRGIPVPQPSTRDKLVASIRRNSYIASDKASQQYASVSSSAASAQQSLSNALLDSWSDSQIKEWADKNGIKVPQGSKRNELIALARKHSAQLTGDNAKSSASSLYGAATTSAGNWYAQSTDDVYGQARHYYDYVLNQFGFASAEAKKSLSSASASASASLSLASKSASSASSVAAKSASSASSLASKSASSASSVAAKSASSLGKDASKSAKSGASQASGAYEKATDRVKAEL